MPKARLKAAPAMPDAESWAANVVPLHMRLVPRHMTVLHRWLEAGRPMGLCDACAYLPEAEGGRGAGWSAEYVLVWVRENASPAYRVSPDGVAWTVTDCIQNRMLARLRSFEEALNFIRPVLQPMRATG